MIIGIGLDVAEVHRFGSRTHPRLYDRILTSRERKLLTGSPQRNREVLAGRFAAKEAVAKAAGTGIGAKIGWQDIEVLPHENGSPCVSLSIAARRKLGWNDKVRIHISIAHTKEIVTVQAVIEQT